MFTSVGLTFWMMDLIDQMVPGHIFHAKVIHEQRGRWIVEYYNGHGEWKGKKWVITKGRVEGVMTWDGVKPMRYVYSHRPTREQVTNYLHQYHAR